MSFWSKVYAITRKDVLAEMRTQEIIPAVLVFTLMDRGNIVNKGSTRALDLPALGRTYHTSTGSEP